MDSLKLKPSISFNALRLLDLLFYWKCLQYPVVGKENKSKTMNAGSSAWAVCVNLDMCHLMRKTIDLFYYLCFLSASWHHAWVFGVNLSSFIMIWWNKVDKRTKKKKFSHCFWKCNRNSRVEFCIVSCLSYFLYASSFRSWWTHPVADEVDREQWEVVTASHEECNLVWCFLGHS